MNFKPTRRTTPAQFGHSTLSAALLGATIFTSNIAHAKPAKIAWKPSFESAMQEAKKSGKPIMVDFYAVWCAPCKLLDKDVYTHAGVVKEARNWVSVKVDAEKRTDLAEKYGVTAFPTIMFLKPNGAISVTKRGLSVPPKQSTNMKTIVNYIRQDMIKTMRAARLKTTTTRA